MFADQYTGRKIFVTGHTGFKGSWLSAWLLALESQVAGFSMGVPTTPSHFKTLGLSSRMKDLRGDIRDRAAVTSAMQDFAPEVVFHLAAQALVRRSYEEPASTIESNALGTMNVLEAVRVCPSVKAVVVITSDKCYRNEEWVWGYRETDHLGGADPYSASKGCAEIIAHSYFQSFFASGPGCATVRAGNVIGGGDWAADRIVPDCARAWAMRKPVSIRSPLATRPWQHVLEPLSGYLWLGARLLHDTAGLPPGAKAVFDPRGQAYNFGPAADVNNTVAEVVEALSVYWPDFCCQMDANGHMGKKESTLLKLCCDKALAELSWKATLNFEETIRYTAEWYARYYEGGSGDGGMWDYTQGQIMAYSGAAAHRGLIWAH